MALADLISPQPIAQQGPGPNDPGGPPPDPRAIAHLAATNPSALTNLVQRNQQRQQEQQPARNFGFGAGAQDPSGVDESYADGGGGVNPAYLNASPNRPPNQWGKSWWPIQADKGYPGLSSGPFMPSPLEAYRNTAVMGNRLAQFSAPGVAGPAGYASGLATQLAPILDALSKGAFSKNFNANQIARINIMRDQMAMQAELAVEQHKQMMLAYGDVFERARLAAEAHGGQLTPGETQQFEQEVRELNAQTGHQKLDTVLQNNHLWGVEKYLKDEDAYARDLEASAATLSKAGANKHSEEMEALGYGAGGRDQLPNLPGAPGSSFAGADIPGAPSTAMAPPSTPGQEANDAAIMKAHGFTPMVMQQAHAEMQGGTGPLGKLTDAAAQRVVGMAKSALAAQEERALSGSGDWKSRLDALSNVDSVDGQRVRGLLNYSLDPNKDFAAQGLNREKYLVMAQRVNPNYKPGNWAAAHEYYMSGTRPSLQMNNLATITKASRNVWLALQDIPENEKIPSREIEKIYNDQLAGDSRYTSLNTALRQYLQIAATVAGGGTQLRVSILKSMTDAVSGTSSGQQIRTVVQLENSDAYARIENYQQRWESLTGTKTLNPALPAEVYRTLDAIQRGNAKNGALPDDKDLPSSLIGVGTTPAGRKGLSLADVDNWRPMTNDQAKQYTQQRKMALKDYIEQNETNPDPTVRDYVKNARIRLNQLKYYMRDNSLDLGDANSAGR